MSDRSETSSTLGELRSHGFIQENVPSHIVQAQNRLIELVLQHFRCGSSNEPFTHTNSFVTGYHERSEGARVFITPLGSIAKDSTDPLLYNPWQNSPDFKTIFEYHVAQLEALAVEIGIPISRQYFIGINYYPRDTGRLRPHTDFGLLTHLV